MKSVISSTLTPSGYPLLFNKLLYIFQRGLTDLYLERLGHLPDYSRPVLYSEKMQWRKLFDRNPLFPLFLDKLAVREYVNKRSPGIKMARVLWQGTDPDAIPFSELPERYVVKPNNHSGKFFFVQPDQVVDYDAIREKCRKWLRQTHGKRNKEWAYKKVPPRLMVEEMIPGHSRDCYFRDFRIYVFDGKVRVTHVATPYIYKSARRVKSTHTYYDENWNQLPYFKARSQTGVSSAEPKPARFNEIISLAENLGADIDHVRVDLYVVDDELYFSELTVYSGSSFTDFGIDKLCGLAPRGGFQQYAGGYWRLPKVSPALKLVRGLSA